MSSVGLNKWIVSGYLAADAEIKTIDLKSGEKAKVAKATIYVRKQRNREESFTVSLSIWEGASAWRKLSFLKKGSLIICTGSIEPNPYISNSDNMPRAGLSMNVLDIDLDNIRSNDEDELPEQTIPDAIIQEVASVPLGQEAQLVSSSGTKNSKSRQTASTNDPASENAIKQMKEEPKAVAKV